MFSCIALLAVPTLPVRADSVLNFPRFSTDPDLLTGIAIANPSLQDAVVTLTAYGPRGELLRGRGFKNPVQLTVSSGRQVAILTSELFGEVIGNSPTIPGRYASIGWFQGTSPVDGLTAFFLLLDASLSRLDGAELAPMAKRIVFNPVGADSEYSIELNIINPGNLPANLELNLAGGPTPVRRTLTLLPKGVARLNPVSFFGAGPLGPAYVSVTSDVEVGGFQVLSRPGGDLLGMNAVIASEQLESLFFPFMVVLGGWKSELSLVNYSTNSVTVTVSAFTPDGTLYGLTHLSRNPVTRSLSPAASLREDIVSMFGFAGADPLTGWVRIESSLPAINGHLTYGGLAQASLASISSARDGKTRALFSHIATVPGYFTGVALLNPGEVVANVRIVVLERTGQVLGHYDTVLSPRQQVSRTIDQLVPAAAGIAGGLIWVRSDSPVYLTSVTGTAAALAAVPPQLVLDSYSPDRGLASLRVKPRLAVVPPDSSQTFQLEGQTENPVWKVNGVEAGNQTVGTISSTGLYRAPKQTPSSRVVTITAETGGSAAGASVDVLAKQPLITGLGWVQSVAFLKSLQKAYTAELTSPGVSTTASPIATYNNEKVSKILPFQASAGKEYLLLTATTTGRIVRLDPATGQSNDVVTGLNEPVALAIDPVSANLLVAERGGVVSVARSLLESNSGSPVSSLQSGLEPARVTLFRAGRPAGIAIDACTGNIYVSDSAYGEVREYVRSTREVRTIVAGLKNPGQLLGSYRAGVSCPNGFNLLVVERDGDRVLLVVPSLGSVTTWQASSRGIDIALLPKDNSLVAGEAILLTESAGQQTHQVSVVTVPDLYRATPINVAP